MFLMDLMRAALRAWYVVVIGALVTALALVAVQRHEGVYYSRAEVRFLAPSSELYPNALTTTSGDIIQTAGVVASVVNGTGQYRKLADAGALLPGRGVRSGSSVTLPDTGGQWAPNFANQLLFVEVVDGSEAAVLAGQKRLSDEIANTLHDLQVDAGVPPVARITTLTPDAPTVYYMNGQPKRALALTAAVGVGLTAWTVLLIDQLRQSRARLRVSSKQPATPSVAHARGHRPA